MTRESFVARLLTYLGSPHVHQGRIKGVAIDCVGLIICAAREEGIDIQDIKRYSTWDSFDRLILNLQREDITSRKIGSAKEILPGDIIVFRSEKIFNHMGVMVDADNFIHAVNVPPISGVRLQELSQEWIDQIHSVWIYKDFEVE